MNKQQLKIDYIEQKNYYKIVYRKIYLTDSFPSDIYFDLFITQPLFNVADAHTLS